MANQNYKQVHLNEDLEERLIEFIKSHPVLYSGSKKPQDLEMRENIWKQIAEDLQISVSDCKMKLKYIIRDRLHRPRKEHKSPIPAAEKPSEAKDEGLKCLPDHGFEHQAAHDDQNYAQETQDLTCGSFYDNESHLEKYQVEVMQQSDHLLPLQHQTVQTDPLPECQIEFLRFHPCGKRPLDCSPKKLKKTKTVAIQENMDYHQAPSLVLPVSPSDLFFQTMAAIVKTFPPTLGVEARMKVCNLVGELELRALTEQAKVCSHGTIPSPPSRSNMCSPGN